MEEDMMRRHLTSGWLAVSLVVACTALPAGVQADSKSKGGQTMQEGASTQGGEQGGQKKHKDGGGGTASTGKGAGPGGTGGSGPKGPGPTAGAGTPGQ